MSRGLAGLPGMQTSGPCRHMPPSLPPTPPPAPPLPETPDSHRLLLPGSKPEPCIPTATLRKSKQNPRVHLTGFLGPAHGRHPTTLTAEPQALRLHWILLVPSHLTSNRFISECILSSSTFKTYTRLTNPHRPLLPLRFQAWLLLLRSPPSSPLSARQRQPGWAWRGARGSSFLLLGTSQGLPLPLSWSLGPLPHTAGSPPTHSPWPTVPHRSSRLPRVGPVPRPLRRARHLPGPMALPLALRRSASSPERPRARSEATASVLLSPYA